MKSTVSIFDALQDGYVVASDPFLDQIVVWNGSATFNVYYSWGKDQWQCIDCFTSYNASSVSDANRIATDYFKMQYEVAAEEHERLQEYNY